MSKIVNLKNYNLVFTTSFENTHGVSGHLYEMIDYFYATTQAGIKSAILLTDGSTKQLIETALRGKYDFDEYEINYYLKNTFECPEPKIIIAPQLCVVDGAPRFGNCVIYTENIWLFRCSWKEYDYFHNHKTIKKTHLLQDFQVYDERYSNLNIEVIDYTKKLLWSRFIKPKSTTSNTSLLYLTTNCRSLEPENVQQIINKGFSEKYILATNNVEKYKNLESNILSVHSVPILNILETFDTYIYTPTPKKFDCSSRFIVECSLYNKKIIYDIDYEDKGLLARRKAIQSNIKNLELTTDDYFINLVKKAIL